MPISSARIVLVLVAGMVGFALSGEGTARWMGAGLALAGAGLAVAVEHRLQSIPPRAVIGGTVGLLAGLLVALLATATVAPEATVPPSVPVVLALFGAYLGAVAGGRRGVSEALPATVQARPNTPSREGNSHKVLDTSVIIDGRIADVIESGFIEGVLVVPQFVLRELQHVADSSDALKRNRGRKGLDILREIQSSPRVRIQLVDSDFPELKDVDAKLLALAEAMGAKILTNDYNLNKVAQLRGVQVLNVNDLANSVKPVVLPGEVLAVQVIKEGKERNQGVGYLDDGTMVVVDAGKRLIGQRVELVVTSVLQTNAGKMIFGMAQDEEIVPPSRPRVVRRVPDDRLPPPEPPPSLETGRDFA